MTASLAPSLLDPEIRLAAYRRLFERFGRRGADLPRAFLDPLARLPFRLGESLAEAKLPYAFDDAFDRLAGEAVATLLDLIQRRFSPTPEGRPVVQRPRPLREESLAPRASVPGSLEAALALRAPRLDPHLDCGLVDSWTARGGPGARLLAGMRALVSRALDLEVRSRGEVPWAWLITLALVDLLETKKALAKEVHLKGLGYERLEKAVGLCLHAGLSVAVEAGLGRLGERPLAVDLEDTRMLVHSALNPLALVSIKNRALQNDLNPWHLSRDAVPVLEDVYEEVLQQDPAPATLEARMWEAVAASADPWEAAARTGLHAEARRRIFEFLALHDDGRTDWMRLLTSVVRRDAELEAVLGRERARTALRQRVERWGRRQRLDTAGAEAWRALLSLLSAPALDALQSRVADLPAPDTLARSGLAAFLAYTFDRFADSRVSEARGHLTDARTEADAARLMEEWEAGRLYRLSTDGQPFVKALRRPTQGQLFIDLKGFTRRTHRAKEVVMADFMRERFYGPILEAARRRNTSVAWSAGDERPVELQNLLGDAAAFAGPVSQLVALARDLRRIGRDYEDRLRSAAPSLAEDVSLGRLEAEAAEASASAARRAQALRKETHLLRGRIARVSRLTLQEKEARVEAALRFPLEEVRKEASQADREGPDAADRLRGLWERELMLQRRLESHARTLEALPAAEREARLDELLCRRDLSRLRELEARLDALRSEEAERRRALEERRRALTGYGLETGIFVAHGASAEVIVIEDEVFGNQRVAISEKINEAARGTARSPLVKAKLDARLAEARRTRADVALPFAVYVDSAWSATFEHALGEGLERALSRGDAAAAHAIVRTMARRMAGDVDALLANPAAPDLHALVPFSDIHNLGVALSEEALEAFIGETLARRLHFRRTVAVEDLHPSLRERFLFLEPELDLVVSVPAGDAPPSGADAQVFRRSGQVRFRGLEGGESPVVYELLGEQSPFFQGLVRHHLPDWVESARSDPRRRLTSLTPGS